MKNTFADFVAEKKPILGVVHLKPLPGSPRFAGQSERRIIDAALADAKALLDAGFDGYVIENFGDVPFYPRAVPPSVVSWMTRVACELPRDSALVVVNVLRNDAAAALAIASAAGLHAIRINVHCGAMVTDQGIVEGHAAETLRLRRDIAPEVAILADVDVKHAVPLGRGFSLEEAARDTAYRGLADGLIVTGRATGAAAAMPDLEVVRAAVPDRPMLVGSGVATKTAKAWLEVADGLIVGTALKKDGHVEEPVDKERATRFIEAVRT